MAKNYNDIIVIKKKKTPIKWVYWIFIALIAFIAIYMPFFGSNLRYQTSSILKTVFSTIGTISIVVGGIACIFGVIDIFSGGKGLGWVLIGGLMLWIGCWLTGVPFLFDFFGTGSGGSSGYH
ncbi:MAG: hypothetical protein ACFFAS_14885 [Promethearchaeota archaeon]